MKWVSLGQVTVLSLLGMAIWLQSPLVAGAVVLALLVKEGREFLDRKVRASEMGTVESRIDALEESLRRLQGETNRIVTKQAQYFGE